MGRISTLQRLLSIKLIMILLVGLLGVTSTSSVLAAPTGIDASAAIMVDAETGQIIYQQNAQKSLPIASISKLLTACVIEDEIRDHQLHWHDQIKINQRIAEISGDSNYSALGLKAGESYTVRSLYRAMLIKSADGAALALATAHGQKMTTFNHKMMKKADQLGLHDYLIVNPVGLNNKDMKRFALPKVSQQAQNSMTAQDVAVVAQTILKDYPAIIDITKRPQDKIIIQKNEEKQYSNSNQMLPGCPYAPQGVTIDGLKTGTSDEAGACFVSTGNYQGHHIITVILHANGDNQNARFVQTQKLYQYLQTNVHPQTLTVPKNQQSMPVDHGQVKQVAVQPRTVTVWVTNNLTQYQLTSHYHRSVLAGRHRLKAPLAKHQQIGYWQVDSPQLQGLHHHVRIPIYISQAVPKASFWDWFKPNNGV